MECFIAGDSLGVGLASVLRCDTDTRGGRPSWLQSPPPGRYPVVIISLGSNDTGRQGERSRAALESLRARTEARCVVWVVPAVGARQVVREVAAAWGDVVVEAAPHVGSDGVHPGGAGYRALAGEVVRACPRFSP